eukprot:TRINITY_DN14174_c0_g1_i2.p1 TRINITY_DN14174_c0_g1~~TRINITY_DN14174_c0_g1_i2.p1  ORF type:complete len:593 (-),score=69.35 TRINITY_DN14174_c0_g1_i2:173-1726(-)
MSYGELAAKYPEAGCGGAYYFAEASFRDTHIKCLRRYRASFKRFIGASSHLFYWIYPGTMVAFMAILLEYLAMHISFNTNPDLCITATDIQIEPKLVCQPELPRFDPPNSAWRILTSFLTTLSVAQICLRGVSGSTFTSHVINAVQLTTLVFLSILFIAFRALDPLHVSDASSPGLHWAYPELIEVLIPYSAIGTVMQASVSILILVGFDSATSLGGDAADPQRDVPRAVLLSLLIQGCFYLLAYFAVNAALGTFYAQLGPNGLERSFRAAGISAAPLGDLTEIVAEQVLGDGMGVGVMYVVACSVLMAVFGSILAALSTAVRFSEAMAVDGEIPQFLAVLNAARMPQHGVELAAAITFAIGSLGSVGGVTTLTAVTMTSNLGTLALYAGVCATTFVSFYGSDEFHMLRHAVVPGIGFIGMVGMILTILFVGGTSGGDTAKATVEALCLLFGLSLGTFLGIQAWQAASREGHAAALDSDQSGSEEGTCEETTVLTGSNTSTASSARHGGVARACVIL